jgi:hypothetical protein
MLSIRSLVSYDYESDKQEQVLDVLQSNPLADDPQLQAAMDVEQTRTTQSPVVNVMDSVYYQCCSPRTMCQKDTLVSVSLEESFGKRVIVQSPNIGSLEDHEGICNTFHGSRIMKGNNIVNESISASFDPAKLVCISCNAEHPVICKKTLPLSVL